MFDIIKRYEAIALSNKDMAKMLNHENKLVLYPDLHKYDNIDDVLGPHGMCTLLFESRPNYGHWTCLWKFDKDTISFFNSYDGLPDDSLEYINNKYKDESHQNYPYLSRLLYDSSYKLTYNEYAYQKHGQDIKTCGRHCIVRLWARKLDDDQYHKYITDFINKYHLKDADEFVTILTMDNDQIKKY